MKQSKTLHTFTLLILIILATAGGVVFLGLQLAPIARELMAPEFTNVDVDVDVAAASTAHTALASVTDLAVADPALSASPATGSSAVDSARPMLATTEGDEAAASGDTASAAVDDLADDEIRLLGTATAEDTQAAATDETADPQMATDNNVTDSTTDRDPTLQRAVVAVAMVNVRSAPSTAGELLTQLSENAELQIITQSRDGEWAQVCCPLGTAATRETWVSTELLRLLPAPADALAAGLAASLPQTTDGTMGQPVAGDSNSDNSSINGLIGVVNSPLVNIRSGPSTQYDVTGQVRETTVLEITGRNPTQDWVQVCCPASGGQVGWINTQFLDINGDKAQVIQTLPMPEIPPVPTSTSPPTTDAVPAHQSAQVATGAGPGLPGGGGFGTPGGSNPLTGQAMAGDRSGQRPIIVCINNDPGARPQLGLSQADIVYEYLMEGLGITRFSAIFYGETVGAIGPVRSARLINYYMGALYDAGLVCSGASDGVRYTLKHEAPFPYLDIDLDDPSNSRYSLSIGTDYRTRLRTSTDGARRWLRDWGVERPPNLRGFTFGEPMGGTAATLVSIPYPSGTGSQVRYQYDAGSGKYLRWLGGYAHVDGNLGRQIAVENVLIQYVIHEATDIVEDSLGSTSIRLNLFGSGQALVFRDGQAFVGTWRSESRGDLPRFYRSDGQEVMLKPGKSWISIVPNSYTITYQ